MITILCRHVLPSSRSRFVHTPPQTCVGLLYRMIATFYDRNRTGVLAILGISSLSMLILQTFVHTTYIYPVAGSPYLWVRHPNSPSLREHERRRALIWRNVLVSRWVSSGFWTSVRSQLNACKINVFLSNFNSLLTFHTPRELPFLRGAYIIAARLPSELASLLLSSRREP